MQSVNKRYSHPCGFDNYNMSENPPIRRDISLRRRFSAAKLLIIFDIRKKICIFHADRLFFIESFQFLYLKYLCAEADACAYNIVERITGMRLGMCFFSGGGAWFWRWRRRSRQGEWRRQESMPIGLRDRRITPKGSLTIPSR